MRSSSGIRWTGRGRRAGPRRRATWRARGARRAGVRAAARARTPRAGARRRVRRARRGRAGRRARRAAPGSGRPGSRRAGGRGVIRRRPLALCRDRGRPFLLGERCAASRSSRTVSSASIASSFISGPTACCENLALSNRSVSARAARRTPTAPRASGRGTRAAPRPASRQAVRREHALEPRVGRDHCAPGIGLGPEVVERLVDRLGDGRGEPGVELAAGALPRAPCVPARDHRQHDQPEVTRTGPTRPRIGRSPTSAESSCRPGSFRLARTPPRARPAPAAARSAAAGPTTSPTATRTSIVPSISARLLRGAVPDCALTLPRRTSR